MTEQSARLVQARQSAGYATAAEAARAFNWSHPTYYSHENGSRGLTLAAAERYGKAFQVSPSWLLIGDQSSNSHVEAQLVRYDRRLLIAAIEGLLTALISGLSGAQATALSQAVLALVEVQDGGVYNEIDLDNFRRTVAAAARLALPGESKVRLRQNAHATPTLPAK